MDQQYIVTIQVVTNCNYKEDVLEITNYFIGEHNIVINNYKILLQLDININIINNLYYYKNWRWIVVGLAEKF